MRRSLGSALRGHADRASAARAVLGMLRVEEDASVARSLAESLVHLGQADLEVGGAYKSPVAKRAAERAVRVIARRARLGR